MEIAQESKKNHKIRFFWEIHWILFSNGNIVKMANPFKMTEMLHFWFLRINRWYNLNNDENSDMIDSLQNKILLKNDALKFFSDNYGITGLQ